MCTSPLLKMKRHQYWSHSASHSPDSHPLFLCGHRSSAPSLHHIHMSKLEGYTFVISGNNFKCNLKACNLSKKPLTFKNIKLVTVKRTLIASNSVTQATTCLL